VLPRSLHTHTQCHTWVSMLLETDGESQPMGTTPTRSTMAPTTASWSSARWWLQLVTNRGDRPWALGAQWLGTTCGRQWNVCVGGHGFQWGPLPSSHWAFECVVASVSQTTSHQQQQAIWPQDSKAGPQRSKGAVCKLQNVGGDDNILLLVGHMR
jgi:hypothetical protein